MKLDVPIVAILRGIDGDFFSDIMQASFSSGLQAIEITLNTPDAVNIIKKNRKDVPSGRFLGAGTVCCLKEAQRAVDAGAMFLVTPNTDEKVIEYGLKQNVPVIAGALTPTEIYRAWALGASSVKVFPVEAMGGARYISDLRGPFQAIPLVPVGGVTLASLADYFQAGATAVGVGSSFFGKEALVERNINELTKNVENYIKSCLQITQSLGIGSFARS